MPRKKSTRPVGRPTKLTEEVKQEILNRLALGETLTDICKDEHMPGRVNVWKLYDKDEKFRNEYIRARELQAHSLLDEAMHNLRNRSRDLIEYEDANGKKILPNHAAVQRDKALADKFFQIAQVLAPRYYAPKQEQIGLTIDLPEVVVNYPGEQPEIPKSITDKLPH